MKNINSIFYQIEEKLDEGIDEMLDGMFSDDAKYLFLARHHTIPNRFRLDDEINCEKANDWFLLNYREAIILCHHTKQLNKKNKLETKDIYYYLFEDLLIHFSMSNSSASILFPRTNADITIINKIIEGIAQFKIGEHSNNREPYVGLLIEASDGKFTENVTFAKFKLSMQGDYGNDSLTFPHIIPERLAFKNNKGTLLLCGKPGIWSISFISDLIAEIKKEIVILPLSIVAAIINPSFINTLIENPNACFEIGNDENIIKDSKKKNKGTWISACLNITEGLPSDWLNIQIICSFNTGLYG